MAGQPQHRQEHDRLFERVLVRAERTLEIRVANGRRSIDLVDPARAPDEKHRDADDEDGQYSDQGSLVVHR